MKLSKFECSIHLCGDASPNVYWALGFVRGGSVVREQIHSKEDVILRASRASYNRERWGKYAEEEYFLS